MPHERFFTDQPLDDRVTLEETEFHHLCRVMRAREGDEIELVNGKNALAEAKITTIGKRHVELEITRVIHGPPPKRPVILAQGIPRLNRLEMILEKGTELGVTEFWLFPGMLSEKETFSPNQHKRMEQILIAAMKQCGRLDLPVISLKSPLVQWKECPGTLFFGDTSAKAPWLWQHSTPLPEHSPVVLFIGPESGFDQREVSHVQGTLGAHGVKLHSNILRTDTAAITGLSLLQLLY
jgi:16S rRNA (uracil1498-N3)-methyltransferase